MPSASAIAAMRVSSSRPPQCLTSGMITLHGTRAAERREAGHAEENFSARHRLLYALANLERLLDTLGRHRLFVPRQLLRLEPARDALGQRHVEEAVAVDHQLDIRPDRLAHRHDARDAVLDGGVDCRRRRTRAAGSHPTARPSPHGTLLSPPRAQRPQILPACAAASRDSRSRTRAGCLEAFRRTGCRSARRAPSRRDPTAPARSRCRPSRESSLVPSRAALRLAGMRRSRAATCPSTSRKNARSSDSICAAFFCDVFANPNASDASPSPVSPASVPRRTKSQTVRAVARIGSSSSVVTRNFGAASRTRGHNTAAAAAFAPVAQQRSSIHAVHPRATRFVTRNGSSVSSAASGRPSVQRK